MKKILSYGGVALVFATINTFATLDSVIAKTDNSRLSNIDNYLQLSTGNWRLVKHSFQLHIPQNDKPLSELIIETPATVAVSNDIEVLDTMGQKVNINLSANGKQIVIDFPNKVISNTILLVNFNKVKEPITGSDSVYRLSAKVVGSDVVIPVGIATFKTF
jgi:hypothetical protein